MNLGENLKLFRVGLSLIFVRLVWMVFETEFVVGFFYLRLGRGLRFVYFENFKKIFGAKELFAFIEQAHAKTSRSRI